MNVGCSTIPNRVIKQQRLFRQPACHTECQGAPRDSHQLRSPASRPAVQAPLPRKLLSSHSMAENVTTSLQVVEISYRELTSGDADLGSKLEAAFGPGGLGLLTVGAVPGFEELRQQLLPMAARMAALPPEAKARCEDPASLYSFGWSEGKEQLQGSQRDTLKGSFYANPLTDYPTHDPALVSAFPSYCRPNIWPGADLPELEPAFKALGQLIIEVGCLLAAHCDRYLAGRGMMLQRSLQDTIARSPCPKGRLLHYSPPPASSGAAGGAEQSWCGWHLDHGSLTGLTSAMFLDSSMRDVGGSPDPQAGLYVRTRSGQVVRAQIPPSHVAYQVGEAMQVQSGGLLRATPHCVMAPRSATAAGISRNTFAVFMQPRWDDEMALPEGAHAAQAGVGQWSPGISFGEFSERTVAGYYGQQT